MIGKIYLFICLVIFIMFWIQVIKVIYLLNEKYDITPLKNIKKTPFSLLEIILKTMIFSIIPIINILIFIGLTQETVINETIEKFVTKYNLQSKVGDSNE